MSSSFDFIITDTQAGDRLDNYLSIVAPELSRTKWQKNMHNVMVNGQKVRDSYRLRAGDLVIADLPLSDDDKPEKDRLTLIAPPAVIPILYEDSSVLVINKPAGIVVYPPEGSNQPSVVEELADKIDDVGERPGVVHRLDKFTSGVMILARNPKAKRFLIGQFQNRSVNKHYSTLVSGKMPHREARVELPVAHSRKSYRLMVVDPNGKPSALQYKVKHHYTHYDLLDVNLLTGRTHQIRVQLSYLGHPVVGDSVYGKSSDLLDRPFLHATSLALKLPNGKSKNFRADLPPELKHVLESLI